MDVFCIVFGAAFTLAGLLFALGRLHVRMAVWKNMPEEEKRRINIAPLCRNIGEVIMLCGIIFLLKGIFADFSGKWFVAVMIAWLLIAGFDVWHISRSSRYKNKGGNTNGQQEGN